jgi:hypothetical protein
LIETPARLIEGAGFTVRTTDWAEAPYVADRVEVALALTALVVAVKLALVCPAPTITVTGTVATAVLLLVRVTIAPSNGAGALRNTAPLTATPPWTLAGKRAIEETAIPGDPEVRVRSACCELLPTVAVIGAVVVAATVLVVMAK